MFDVIIAGGGIAGLSAALVLGRCRRTVLVCDTGKPRNRVSQALHGFLSRDGIDPLELRMIGRSQLEVYDTVTLREKEVVDAEETDSGYRVTFEDGESSLCSFFILATGIVDRLPPIKGVEALYGRNVFHCPYCDGWEVRDQPLAVHGAGREGADYALELTGWSRDIVLCVDGGELPSAELRAKLKRNRIGIRTEPIAHLETEGTELMRISFNGAEPLTRRALFFSPDQVQATPLAEKLGCSIKGGVVETAKFQRTAPRLFVIGDAARSVQLAIVAAAEGAEAAFAVNTALLKKNLTP